MESVTPVQRSLSGLSENASFTWTLAPPKAKGREQRHYAKFASYTTLPAACQDRTCRELYHFWLAIFTGVETPPGPALLLVDIVPMAAGICRCIQKFENMKLRFFHHTFKYQLIPFGLG